MQAVAAEFSGYAEKFHCFAIQLDAVAKCLQARPIGTNNAPRERWEALGCQALSRAQGSIGVPPVFSIRVQDDDQKLAGRTLPRSH